jgi:uncharacterized protein
MVAHHEGVTTAGVTPAWPGSDPPEVRETHSAVLFLVGDRVYKLKKPVDLGFLDFRAREAREAVCHREVELNRRLAPDVYLGVADVLGPDGSPCDHLVVMRRMPDDRRLATLVADGAPVEGALRQLAHLVASFLEGADAPPAAREAASRDALAARWEANIDVIEGFVGDVVDRSTADRVAMLARRYLAGRDRLFERRIADGRARDGHGDLLADDIFCLDDGPRVLDCIEFDDRLRQGDVLADVAFLAMDLERLGRRDLGQSFLSTVAELMGDTWPATLAHHHTAYRADVRAKVACMRHAQGDEHARHEARQLLAIALDHLEAGRVHLVVVGGLPATGKSTVAAGVAAELGAVVIRSDEVRKELAGVPAGRSAAAPLGKGIYSPHSTDATYRELLVRARSLLELGESVVLDATWQDPDHRRAATVLAAETVADLTELRCVCPVDVAARRATRRSAEGGDPSDATESVIRAMAAAEVPWPTATTIETRGAPASSVAAALDAVERGAS